MQDVIRMGSGLTDSHSMTHDHRSRPWRRGYIRAVTAGVVLITLAGCGAHVADVSSSVTNSPAPSEILVNVVPDQEGSASPSDEVAARIQSAVVDRLTESHVTAEPYVAGTVHPGAAVIQISVMQANPGNLLGRFLIGFGVGEAKLAVRADLIVADQPVLTFNASANSGMQPGLVLPGAVALGTGRMIGLAIGGGINVATNIHGGLDRPENSTATAIVAQLKNYYATAGWQWTGA